MLRKLCLVLSLLLVAVPANAQLNLSYTSFQPGQTISSTQFTANFTAISNNAFNRAGGELIGSVTFGTHNTYDIGTTTHRLRDLWIGRNVDIDGTLDVAGAANFAGITVTGLTCTGCVGATQIASTTVSGGSYGSASAVGTFTVDADGRLTAAANASIVIAEAAITDGALLARVADSETISGAWTFTNSAPITLTSANPQLFFRESDAGTNEKVWRLLANSDSFLITMLDDANANNVSLLTFTRTGLTPGGMFVGTDLLPDADSTRDIGSSSVRWDTVYADNIDVAGTLAFNSISVDSGSAAAPSVEIGTGTGLYTTTDLFASTCIAFETYGLGQTPPKFQVCQGEGILISANIIPDSSDVNNLGSSGSRFNNLYLVNSPDVSSDIRLKENIIDLPYGLETLKKINVYQYNLKSDPSRIHYGVIAQQLKEIGLDHIVAGSDEDGYGVAYTELIPILIKSIKELEARVAELEAK